MASAPRTTRRPRAAASPVAAALAPAPRAFPQARARATHRALLEGARAVFAERGFDAAQTPEIAARAGVSVGTFYRYFDDKRQALLELMRAHLAETSAQVLAELGPERFAGGDHRSVGAVIDAAIEVLFEEANRYPSLERLYQEMALRDAEVAAVRAAFEEASEAALAQVIAAVTSRKAIPDPRVAAHVVFRAGVLIAVAEASGDGEAPRRRRVSQRAVKRALRDMMHRYLFPATAGSSMTKSTRSPSSRKMRPPWASTARRQK